LDLIKHTPFFIYKHKDCIRNVSELESATIDPEREEIIRVKNEKAKQKNKMKEFLDHNEYSQRHTASALERANDVHTEEIESVQTGGGVSKIITGGKKGVGFTTPLYCYLIINFTDKLDFLEVL
jgi:hypothetical protein